jgi:hypothetical protein
VDHVITFSSDILADMGGECSRCGGGGEGEVYTVFW